MTNPSEGHYQTPYIIRVVWRNDKRSAHTAMLRQCGARAYHQQVWLV
jgi:hypothetical protein